MTESKVRRDLRPKIKRMKKYQVRGLRINGGELNRKREKNPQKGSTREGYKMEDNFSPFVVPRMGVKGRENGAHEHEIAQTAQMA